MRALLILLVIVLSCMVVGLPVEPLPKADLVIVNKSERKLLLLRGGNVIASFRVALGFQPRGPKERQGDGRTPEGTYMLTQKNEQSMAYKSIRISYPTEEQKARARAQKYRTGSSIMIHGQLNGWGWLGPIRQYFDWTQGCIAVTNGDLDRIWQSVDVPTPIHILP